jgi:hypothetical protein
MAVILGMSNVLRRDGLTPERTREIASDIAESAESAESAEVLSTLLDSMLLLARLELGGRIWARQRPTGGAEFGFAVPVHRGPAD